MTYVILSPNNLQRPGSARSLQVGVLALLGILIALPILTMLVEVFRADGSWTLANLEVVLLNSRQLGLLKNSLGVSLGAALVALILGIPYGILIARTNVPGRKFFAAAGLLPLIIPPLISAIAWVGLFQIQGPIWAALIFGFSYFPFVWILTSLALGRVDARIEDAALLAGGWPAAMRVQAPLILPSALIGALLVFVFAIADFTVPDYLSVVGPKFNVYPDDIFFRWKQIHRTGEAVAASIPPVLLIGGALFAILRLRRRTLPPVRPGFENPVRRSLGKIRGLGLAFLVVVVALTSGLPLAQLTWEAEGWEYYQTAINFSEGGGEDLRNSLVLAFLAASLAFVLMIFPARLSQHRRFGFLVDLSFLLPLALPALLLAIGLIRVWNQDFLTFGTPNEEGGMDWFNPVYDTKAIVIMAYLVRFAAFVYFAGAEAFRAVEPGFEEAGAISGIPWWGRFRSIVFPLVRPAMLAGAVMVFVFSMREIDGVALIPQGNATIMFRIYNYIHFGRDQLIAALSLIAIFMTAFPVILFRIWGPGQRSEIG